MEFAAMVPAFRITLQSARPAMFNENGTDFLKLPATTTSMPASVFNHNILLKFIRKG
jgi:hypothetical protein